MFILVLSPKEIITFNKGVYNNIHDAKNCTKNYVEGLKELDIENDMLEDLQLAVEEGHSIEDIQKEIEILVSGNRIMMLRLLQLYSAVIYHGDIVMKYISKDLHIHMMKKVYRKCSNIKHLHNNILDQLKKYAHDHFKTDRIFQEGYEDSLSIKTMERVRKILLPNSII